MQNQPVQIAFSASKVALSNLTHIIRVYRDNHDKIDDAPHGPGVTDYATQELERMERQSAIAGKALGLLVRCGKGEIERPLHERTLWPETLWALDVLVKEIDMQEAA